MIAIVLSACVFAASESLPLAGILGNPKQVELVRAVESALEANPAILALHRAHLRTAQASPGRNAQAQVDAALYEVMARRMASSQSLLRDESLGDEDAGALGAFSQIAGAESLAANPRLAHGSGLSADALNRMLSALTPSAGGRPDTDLGFPALPPVPLEPLRPSATEARPSGVETQLREMVAAHETLRSRYDVYLDILARYPEIERAADVYWSRLEAVQLKPARSVSTVGESPVGVEGPERPRRPTVPRPARPGALPRR